MSRPELLNRELATGKQDVTCVSLWKLASYRLRVDIRRDSYDFQSHANVDVWSGMASRWEHVSSIHWSHMATRRELNREKHDWFIQNYAADEESLLKAASLVLGVPQPFEPTPQFMATVAEHLRVDAGFSGADVEYTGGGNYCIRLDVGDGIFTWWGVANDKWGCDINENDGEFCNGFVEADCLTTEPDASAVALAITQAMAAHDFTKYRVAARVRKALSLPVLLVRDSIRVSLPLLRHELLFTNQDLANFDPAVWHLLPDVPSDSTDVEHISAAIIAAVREYAQRNAKVQA